MNGHNNADSSFSHILHHTAFVLLHPALHVEATRSMDFFSPSYEHCLYGEIVFGPVERNARSRTKHLVVQLVPLGMVDSINPPLRLNDQTSVLLNLGGSTRCGSLPRVGNSRSILSSTREDLRSGRVGSHVHRQPGFGARPQELSWVLGGLLRETRRRVVVKDEGVVDTDTSRSARVAQCSFADKFRRGKVKRGL